MAQYLDADYWGIDDEEEVIEFVIDRITFNEQDLVVDPELETDKGWGQDTSYIEEEYSIFTDKDFRVSKKKPKKKGEKTKQKWVIKKIVKKKIKKVTKMKKAKKPKKKQPIKRIPKLSTRKKLEAAIKKAARKIFDTGG